MRLDATARIDLGDLKRFAREMPQVVDAGIRKAAFAAQRKAQLATPVDTGALRSSIYTVTSRRSARSAAMASARARRADVRPAQALPPDAVRPMEAWIACGVEYGMYIEYGTMSGLGPRNWLAATVLPGQDQHYRQGVYSFRPGYLFMTDAREWARQNAAGFVRAELVRRGAL